MTFGQVGNLIICLGGQKIENEDALKEQRWFSISS